MTGSTETQDTTSKNTQTSNGHPSLSAHEVWIQRCKELHDKEDGILTTRKTQERQAKTRAMYNSAHLLNTNDRQIVDTPIDERWDSRLGNLKAWVKQLYSVLQKGIQDAHKQIHASLKMKRDLFLESSASRQYEDTGPSKLSLFHRLPLKKKNLILFLSEHSLDYSELVCVSFGLESCRAAAVAKVQNPGLCCVEMDS
jgi:hypothetical protein